jgi:hypothetical protein
MVRRAAFTLPVFVYLCLATASADAATWYVDKDNASTVRNGASWATAFTTVQPAIDAAQRAGGGEIWVAEGTYGEERTSPMHFPRVDTGSIVMRSGVHLYGGFSGTETQRSQRDPQTHPTLLDGSRALLGLPALHVVVAADNATLDGFVIRGGHNVPVQTGLPANIALGAGLYGDAAMTTVANCVFMENIAASKGGAVYIQGGNFTFSACVFLENEAIQGAGLYIHSGKAALTDCYFKNNKASGSGGGIGADNSDLTVQRSSIAANTAVLGGGFWAKGMTLASVADTTFAANRANYGGGVQLESTMPQFARCAFLGNSVTGAGGALRLLTCDTPGTLENCVFWRNTSKSPGGAILSEFSKAALLNCSFAQNDNVQPLPDPPTEEPLPDVPSGDTLYVAVIKGTPGLVVKNCIFPGTAKKEFHAPDGGLSISYSLVEGGYDGTGNVNGTPAFMAADAGDLRLAAGSPGLDAGTSDGAAAGDFLGLTRPQGALVDMGAFERPLSIQDSDGDGIPNIYEPGNTDGDSKPDAVDTDSDNDGIPDAVEGMADVDGDGSRNFTDTDSDDDGVDDAVERALLMDAYKWDDPEGDPDKDGLTTAEEVELGSRPYEEDSDGDTMPDGWEVSHNLNPISAADANGDADRDGVGNADEFRVGSNPSDPADPPRDVYVSPTGSDSTGLGSPSRPWRTIRWANDIYNAGRYYMLQDVTIHLLAGTYEEPVNLLPNTTLMGDSPQTTTLQYFKTSDAEHVVVRGAEGATLRNLRVKATGSTTAAVTLVKIDGVATGLSNVLLDGNYMPYSEGIRLLGAKSSGSIIQDSTFRRMDRGAVAINSGATFARNLFEDIFTDGIFARPPEAVEPDPESTDEPEPLVAPNLGDTTALETTGLNRFRNVFRYAVLNVSSESIKAENNDWGVYSQPAVTAKYAGTVDSLPYVGAALASGTVAVRLRDAATNETVALSANPQVALAKPETLGLRDETSGLWLISGAPLGRRIVSAAADGYAVGVRTSTASSDGVAGLEFAMLAAGVASPYNVDRLGKINALDVQLVIVSALGVNIPFIDTDLNNDGRVNAIDVQAIIRAVLQGLS